MRAVALIACLLMTLPAQAAQKVEIVPSSLSGPVWALPDTNTNIVTVELSFVGGISADSAAKAGRSSLMSNLIYRGAGDLDAEAFARALKDNGVSLSVDVGRDEAVIRLSAPAGRWNTALALLGDIVARPRFDQTEFARSRAEQIAAIRNQTADPEWRAQRLINGLVYENTPYAQPGMGSVASLNRLTRDDMVAAHKAIFGFAPRSAVFVGQVDPARIQSVLALFAHSPAAPAADTATDYRHLSPARQVFHPYDVPQANIIYTVPGLPVDDPDFAALSVLDALLADGFGSRLMKAVREDSGLSYGIHSALANADHGPLWQFSLSAPSDKIDLVADKIRSVLKDAADKPFTDAEVKDAAESLAARLPMGWTSSPAIAAQLGAAQRDGWGPDYLDAWSARLRAVTPADLTRVAQRLLDGKTGIMAVVGRSLPSSEWQDTPVLPGLQ